MTQYIDCTVNWGVLSFFDQFTLCVCDCHSSQGIESEPNQGYIASRQVQNKASARLVSMAVYYIIYPILIRESMVTWTIPYINGNENMYQPFWISWFFHEKSHYHPNCFACLWFCFEKVSRVRLARLPEFSRVTTRRAGLPVKWYSSLWKWKYLHRYMLLEKTTQDLIW